MDDQNEEVNVRFGATIDDLKAKLSEVINLFGGIKDGAQKELAERAVASFGKFGEAASTVFGEVSKRAAEIPESMRVVGTAVAGVLAVIGAGYAAKRFADANAEMVESTRDFARALGTTTNEASVLQAALEDVGSTQGEYIAASRGLSRQLRMNEGDVKALGLATRDSAGNLRPMNDLIVDAIALLNDHKAGTDRSIAGQTLFGRGVDASSRLLLLNKDVIEENRAAVEELGLEVGLAATDAYKEYDAASDRAALTMKAFGKAIGESVLPFVTQLTEWFNKVGPAAITVIRGALGGLTTAFVSLTNGVGVLWATINAMVITVAEPLVAMGRAIASVLSGEGLEAAAEHLRNIPRNVKSAWDTALDDIVSGSEKARKRIAGIWAFATDGNKAPGDTGAPDGTRGAKDLNRGGSTTSAELALQRAMQEAALKLELEYLKQAQDHYDQAYKEGLLSTREYFDAKLAIEQRAAELSIEAKQRELEAAKAAEAKARGDVGAASKPQERAKAESEVLKYQTEQVKLAGEIAVLEAKRVDAVRQIGNQYSDVTRKLEADLGGIRAARAKQAADAEVAAQRAAVDQMLAMRQISAEEAFAIQRRLEARLAEAARADIEARRALIQGSQAEQVVQQERLNAELEAAEQQHQDRLTQINNAADRERAKYSLDAQRSIQASFATFLTDLMERTKSVGQAFRDMALSIARAFENLIAQRFVERLFGPGTAGGAFIDGLIQPIVRSIGSIATAFLEAFGLIAPAQHAVGATTVLSNAAMAATAAMASVAAIPFVGWAMAPEVGAATYATALGYLASAEGGWGEVPQDGVLTQLHKREMVLPASLAEGVRRMTQMPAGVQPAAAADGARAMTVNLKIENHLIDGRGGEQFIQSQASAIVKAVKKAHRDFRFA